MQSRPDLTDRLEKLEQKYQAMGQDLASYLDGLLYSEYLTYWDYIHLDTLLSLQSPKTNFPDEKIFIMYHQITELYFKLMLHEIEQIGLKENLTEQFFITRLDRITRYFENLTQSFEIMVDGMDKEEFLKFRMSLLPASGFQSVQYRMIEIGSTDFIHLVSSEYKAKLAAGNPSVEEMFEFIYWKAGATEMSTGKKTLTLNQFENKYSETLIDLAKKMKNRNLWYVYKQLPETAQKNPELIHALKTLDVNVNVNWPLSHYKSAVRYLHKKPEDIAATGGTNWQKYLPPRFQKRIFYPELWTAEEIENWGLKWVKREVFGAV